jgi:hypothetical protein
MNSALAWLLLASMCVWRGNDAAPPNEDSQLAAFVLAGMRDERERLRSGIFRASGTRTVEAEPGKNHVVRIELFSAFDRDNDRFRFDRLETDVTPNVPVRPRGGKYIRTAEQSIHASDEGPGTAVTVMAPDHPPHIDPFDVRSIGIALPQELSIGFQEFLSFFSEEQVVESAEKQDEMYCVTWLSGKNHELRRRVWIDEQLGWAPAQFEASVQVPGGTNIVRQVMDVEWRRVSQVVVPVKLVAESRRVVDKLELTFDWVAVNRPIDAKYFSIDGLNLDTGTYIADGRLGPAVLVEIVGQNEPTASLLPARTAKPTDPKGRQALWLVAAACAVVALGVMVWFVRRQTRVGR